MWQEPPAKEREPDLPDAEADQNIIWDSVSYRRLTNGVIINPRNYKACGTLNEELQQIYFNEEED